MFYWLLLLETTISFLAVPVEGHGRLVEPPSRASAWRYGFGTKVNYDDNQLYCGGAARQHQINQGRCGLCGDAWDLPTPRPNENGGIYGQGVIVRSYPLHSNIEIGVDLAANHLGYFEFRICSLDNPPQKETEECFDQHLLKRADGEGTRYYPAPKENNEMKIMYKLPRDLTCNHCVLQWRYIAGNNWGICSNGTGKVGCGPQEEFRSCSDIRIGQEDLTNNSIPLTPFTTTATTTISPRTRGTVTSRFTKTTQATTQVQTTESVEFTTKPSTIPHSSSTSTTTTTVITPISSTTENSGFNSDAYWTPGPYPGIVIALATLLFAILLMGCVVIYFYRGHEQLKAWIRQHFKRKGADNSRKSLKLPASILAAHTPHLTVEDIKPQIPVRSKRNGLSVRQLSLTISEPIDVTINGVSVPRDEYNVQHPTGSSDSCA